MPGGKKRNVQNVKELHSFFRMPDRDFSVSDVKLFVGKFLFYFFSICIYYSLNKYKFCYMFVLKCLIYYY